VKYLFHPDKGSEGGKSPVKVPKWRFVNKVNWLWAK